MQSGLSIASPVPAAPVAPTTSIMAANNTSSTLTTFGGELARLLTAGVRPGGTMTSNAPVDQALSADPVAPSVTDPSQTTGEASGPQQTQNGWTMQRGSLPACKLSLADMPSETPVPAATNGKPTSSQLGREQEATPPSTENVAEPAAPSNQAAAAQRVQGASTMLHGSLSVGGVSSAEPDADVPVMAATPGKATAASPSAGEQAATPPASAKPVADAGTPSKQATAAQRVQGASEMPQGSLPVGDASSIEPVADVPAPAATTTNANTSSQSARGRAATPPPEAVGDAATLSRKAAAAQQTQNALTMPRSTLPLHELPSVEAAAGATTPAGVVTVSPQPAQEHVATPSPPIETMPDAATPAKSATASPTLPQYAPKEPLPASQKPVAGKSGDSDAAPKRTAARNPPTAANAHQTASVDVQADPTTSLYAQAAAVTQAVSDSTREDEHPGSKPSGITAITGRSPNTALAAPAGSKPGDTGPTEADAPPATVTFPQSAPAAESAQQTGTTLHQEVALAPAMSIGSSQQPAAAADATPSHVASTGRSPSAAAQVTPALVQIGHASDGTQRLTVRLQPPELGQVEVRIDRPHESPVRVEITVEKPETLTLLLRDQPQLQRALDQAGVPAEGRSITFHVAPADQLSRNEPATPAAGVAAGGPGSGGSQGTPQNGGKAAHQQADSSDDTVVESTPVGLSAWMRGGLDITA